MASATFGVTTATVQAEALASLQSISSAALTVAINDAASDVCSLLSAQDITPSSVTQLAYPDDYDWLHTTVTVGAAFTYLRNTSGSTDAAVSFERQYGARLRQLRDMPNFLQSYNSNTGGANTVLSHMSDLSETQIEERRARLLRPSRPTSWML